MVIINCRVLDYEKVLINNSLNKHRSKIYLGAFQVSKSMQQYICNSEIQ